MMKKPNVWTRYLFNLRGLKTLTVLSPLKGESERTCVGDKLPWSRGTRFAVKRKVLKGAGIPRETDAWV